MEKRPKSQFEKFLKFSPGLELFTVAHRIQEERSEMHFVALDALRILVEC